MCTVTFFPTTQGFILTQNRDEKPTRSTESITKIKSNDLLIQYPTDLAAQGTWIFTRSDGFHACLLNGAFELHQKQSNYRKSRGIIMKEFSISNEPHKWLQKIDLTEIEPFTILYIVEKSLTELRWDGIKKIFIPLAANNSYIWSSVTLYPLEIRMAREELFKQWFPHPDPNTITSIKILDFHYQGNLGDEKNNLQMSRTNGTKTVSITQIESVNGDSRMRYFDLINADKILVNYIQTREN